MTHSVNFGMLQNRAQQETERANAAEAVVSRLEQEAQTRNNEGRARQGELEQAQQDLSAAQVKHTCFFVAYSR